MRQFYTMDARDYGYHSNAGVLASLAFSMSNDHRDIAAMHPKGSRQHEFHTSVANAHTQLAHEQAAEGTKRVGSKAEKMDVSPKQKKYLRSEN